MTHTAETKAANGRIEFSLKGFVTAAIGYLIEADRRHREARKLRKMPDFRLKDMGLTREDADRAFLRRGA